MWSLCSYQLESVVKPSSFITILTMCFICYFLLDLLSDFSDACTAHIFGGCMCTVHDGMEMVQVTPLASFP